MYDEYRINMDQYSSLLEEEFLPKIKQVYATTNTVKEDSTDELWTVLDEI